MFKHGIETWRMSRQRLLEICDVLAPLMDKWEAEEKESKHG
jgi:hypothetical protein